MLSGPGPGRDPPELEIPLEQEASTSIAFSGPSAAWHLHACTLSGFRVWNDTRAC